MVATAPAPGRTASAPPRRRRPVAVLLALLVLLAVAVVLSVAVGAALLSPAEVWQALVAPTGSPDDVIVRDLRIPRTLLGVLVGIGLGVAGALMQGHTRNPLADPGLLGVNAGAGFLLVLAVNVLGLTQPSGYLWFCFAGAAIAGALVFALGSLGRRGITPVTLALGGFAVSELLLALTSGLVLGDGVSLDAYRFWIAGALDDRNTAIIGQVLPFFLLGLVLAAANAPALNVLALGDDAARGLGARLGRARFVGIAAVTLLAGSAVAASGPINFVGLVAPHVVRSFTGPDHRWLLPGSALAGAVLVLLADVVGRVVVRPGELQAGIVVALVGAPFFIALVRRRRVRL